MYEERSPQWWTFTNTTIVGPGLEEEWSPQWWDRLWDEYFLSRSRRGMSLQWWDLHQNDYFWSQSRRGNGVLMGLLSNCCNQSCSNVFDYSHMIFFHGCEVSF